MDIVNSLISAIEHFQFLSYWVILAVFILEALAFVGLFIPGATILVLIGFLCAEDALKILPIFVAVFFGSIIGDYLSFNLGAKGVKILDKNNQNALVADYLEKSEKFLLSHGNKSIFIGRFIGWIRPVLPFLAGFLKMDKRRFYIINSFSLFVWIVSFLFLGYFFGHAWKQIEILAGRAAIFSLAFFILFFLIYLIRLSFIKKGSGFLNLLKFLLKYLWREIGVRFGLDNFIVRHPAFFYFIKNRLSWNDFFGLPLTLILLTIAYIAFLFAGIAEAILKEGILAEIDYALVEYFYRFRQETIIYFFHIISFAGRFWLGAIIAFAASVFFWLKKRNYYLPAIWAVFIGNEAITYLTKFILQRPRPEDIIFKEKFFSFPSGHASLVLALYGLLAYLFIRETNNWKSKVNIFFFTFTAIAFIGFSRLYLGAHYLSDVAGGYLLGLAWLLIGVSIIKWKEKRG
jgi:undecaprenyl-diphosphatase